MTTTQTEAIDKVARSAAYVLAPVFRQHNWTWATLGPRVPSESEIAEDIVFKIRRLIDNPDVLAASSGRITVSRDEDEGHLYGYEVSLDLGIVFADELEPLTAVDD